MSSDLLFEIGSEELPSGAVWPLADALANNVITGFAKAGLHHGNVRRYASPRRLAILVEGLQTVQESQNIVKRGPTYTPLSEGETPSPALLGFAKSCGVSVSELTKLSTEKGEWWAYESTNPGKSTLELLPELLKDAIKGLPIAKPMRWGDGEEEFARPVHWAVLLFGNEVISAQILGIKTGSHSYGHRFHHPGSVEITTPHIYESLLKDAFVIADFKVRRQMIVEQVEALAKQYGYRAEMPEALVDEVTSIVEWPQALIANFESEFLQVPAEALIAAMQSHQKCFALRDAEGKLVPHFITVANINSTQPNQVIQGNEKVMRARLSDAAFFFHQDKKQRLNDYRASTANVIFQARLGSLQEKTNRMELLIEELISPLQLNKKEAVRSTQLSKCDLMTGMVGEFPELQGLMGYYYALNDNEGESVAQSLNEQYMPRFAADDLPCSPLGLALSLVDRLDTLVGTFAIGEKPTGVKDPFKLRRHALAVVRMLIATPAPLSLSMLLQRTLQTYGNSLTLKDPNAMEELRIFILERMNSYYQANEVPNDVVLSVRARQDDWLYDVDKRIDALMTFLTMPESNILSAACKRVNNILQQSAGLINHKTIDSNLLREAAEKTLFDHIERTEALVMPLYSAKDYGAILTQLASLRAPVDAFFDQVLVMVDEPALKENRLCLLARLRTLLQGVADISLLQFGA
jgi:glycyl-tRNA synthetase beta chain